MSWNDFQKTIVSPHADAFDAAREGRLSDLIARLSTLPDINYKDAKGYSVLMLAAYHGHADLVGYLLSQNADPNTVDAGGNSVLMGAAFKGHAAIVRRLLAAGADRHYRNSKGQTALDFAQLFARRDVISHLSSQSAISRTQTIPQALAAWWRFIKGASRER